MKIPQYLLSHKDIQDWLLAHLAKRKSGAAILVDTMKTRRKIHKV